MAIINANGFEDKFISKLQCNLEIIKSRIKNKDIESWHSVVKKKIKLKKHVTFKNEFNVEPYLLNPIQKCQSFVFAKLTCGILPLHIKTGQYTNTALQNWLCEFCEKHVIEDEKHFICSCLFYNDLRNSLYLANDKFVYMLQNKHQLVTKVCHQALSKRR